MESRPLSALIVDDDAGMSRMFSRCLSLWGWAVAESRSAADACRLYAPGRYGLVVCDVDLPDGDGISLARELLRAEPLLRVVVTSGDPANLERAREAGFAWRLPKPFDLRELEAAVDRRQTTSEGARDKAGETAQ